MVKISCPKCEAKKVYLLFNGKRKCSRCKYEFTPHRLPLYLTRDRWREIIRWFLLEQSSQNISLRTGFERRRVMRALTIIRTSLMKDVPEIFSGTVEVDETYLGGQWKNKRRPIRDLGSKRGRGTTKQPVFGILCRNGTVWAEVVDDVGAETLQPLISKKVSAGSIVCSDTCRYRFARIRPPSC
jgi:transposase